MKNKSDDFLGNFSCEDCGHNDCLSVYQREDESFYGICRSECSSDKDGFKNQSTLYNWECGSELEIPKPEGGRSKPKVTTKTIKRTTKKKKSESIPLTEEEFSEILESSSEEGSKYRGVPDSILKSLMIRTGYDAEGQVAYRYYWVTKGNDIVGCHVRSCQGKKYFWSKGLNGTDVDLFNQAKCKNSKKLLITGGAEDVAAADTIIKEYRKKKGGKYAPIDVVSSSCGEGNLAEQIRTNWDFVTRYEEIIFNYDNDSTGCKVKDEIIELLPRKKLKIMTPVDGCKDASDILQIEDRTVREAAKTQYINNLYGAKVPTLAGTVDGDTYWELMQEALFKPKIPLPPCFSTLQKMLVGGFPSGEIINILAGSGIGKTTIVNTLLRFWRYESPYSMAIFSLEAGGGKFLNRLMSGHLGVNLALFEDPSKAWEIMLERKEEVDSLLYLEDRTPAFTLMDDRGDLDTLEKIQDLTEAVIKRDERELIIFDPVSDLLDGLSREDQENFVTWEKRLKGMYGVTILNVVHARKGNSGKSVASKGGELTEEDMQGTSALYKSGAVNIIFTRDKTSDDPLIRNTLNIMTSKARDTGATGPSGVLIYDLDTGTFEDAESYMNKKSETISRRTINEK